MQENVITNINKLHIDITIPFFLNSCIHRTNLTELAFKHYTNIKHKLSDKANITFTFVGSDKDVSKNLALKYVNENEYFEFDQHPYHIFDNASYRTNIHKKNYYPNFLFTFYDNFIFWFGITYFDGTVFFNFTTQNFFRDRIFDVSLY